ncbi:MAG: type II secretion system protein [Kiritimatiellia bacterium]|jgi:prepilin-type N-terminal cleavage/methylation domain-containing protein
MNYSNTYHRRAGFTLLELLVTVSILAILMGLIVPMYGNMKKNARIASDKVTAKNLETAFRAYLDHYSTWPSCVNDSEKKIEGDIYKMLSGEASTANPNPDKIVFYEFSNTNAGDKAVDAFWGLGENDNEHVFRVKFDHNYDNVINHKNNVIRRPVIVWSVGPDGTNDTSDDITSW